MNVDVTRAAEAIFREEHGRILAALIRIGGSFDLAEDAMQDAFASALATWGDRGIPANPGAWITAAAHRKMLDRFRRARTRTEKEPELRYELNRQADADNEADNQASGEADAAAHFPDDRLRLIFTCCHPALNREGQVALTLRTLGGLTTGEIARAFLLPETTLAQRLVRAKRKIQDAGIPYQIPGPERLAERLSGVQAVVYLIFNEGYLATAGDDLVRVGLCEEAIRLARILTGLLPDNPETKGLLALMLLHDSRRNARIRDGRLITLDEQDRSLWDPARIAEGVALVESALRQGAIGHYQIQSAIAAVHAESPTADETDWPQIARLYERLLVFQNTPVVRLNHAVAVAMSGDLEGGLGLIETLDASGDLRRYHLFHAARADVLRRMHRVAEACEAYRVALSLSANRLEREFLERRIEAIERL